MEGFKTSVPAGSVLDRRVPLPAGVAVPPPRLEDVRPEDLGDSERLEELHRQAAARGLVGISEADRLKFAAAAEHARSVGKSNPCGLFARIVARGWWDFATLAEEERAARRLRDYGRGTVVPGPSSARPGPDRQPASVGMVLERLGLGPIPEGPGPIGPAHTAGAMTPGRLGRNARGRGVRGSAEVVSMETDAGSLGDAEAAMLARWARLMGGAS